jgi:Tol biopolymer transport system component
MVGVLFSSGGSRTATISEASATVSSSPGATERVPTRPKPISENQVVSVSAAKESDTVRYYERETGKAFSVNLPMQKTAILSDVRLPGFLGTYWLPYSDKVISEFQEPAGISYRLFDYTTKATTVIGSDITALTPSPDGLQIAYMKPSGDAADLFVSDDDGSNPRKLLTTRAQDVHLYWPVKDGIALSSRRADRTGSDLSMIDLQGALAIVMTDRDNLEYVWSPDGTHLLYSYYTENDGTTLHVRDMATGYDSLLGLATSARKCAWHGNTLVITCGVPANNSLSGPIPADRSSTIDDIVTLDMTTGLQTRLYSGVSTNLIGVIDPMVSSSEGYFVFTNLFDQRLYSFPL